MLRLQNLHPASRLIISPACGATRFWTGRRHMSEGARIAALSIDDWAKEFKAATVDLASMDIRTISYQESASRLRKLMQTGLLRNTDLVNKPDRFFLAHRLLAEHAPQLGPGFWIRMTVHLNLCAGTVLGLGNDSQVAMLDEWQEKGFLGCFSLTEKLAGVNSGLVVNTVATYDEAADEFVLNSPDRGAWKNWISQGLVADKTVVVASLVLKGKPLGPHAFVMDLRQNGSVVSGVELEDMGRKTIGNDLDNAAIAFHGVRLPRSALLNRFADIEGGEYVQKVKGMPVFHMIGQRLFSGRVAVAQAALGFRQGLFALTKRYADTKKCWAPAGEPVLSSIPQLKALFRENADKQTKLDAFVGKCESELSAALVNNNVPSLPLVEAIAVAKVKAVEESIELCHRLQNEVGSYALMGGTGFEQKDFLTCCKFAEGDSRVLMLKMARDRLKLFEKRPPAGNPSSWGEEDRLCAELASKMEAEVEASGDRQRAWDENWEAVYHLAEVYMQRVMRDFMSS